jgi:hypothetical protein
MLELSKRVPFPSLVCSYGGHQSNSMLAIARIVASHSSNSDFVYFCKALPSFLRSKMIGNLKAASELGMKVAQYFSKRFFRCLHSHPMICHICGPHSYYLSLLRCQRMFTIR